MSTNKPKTLWRKKLHEIIYEADTSAGKFFDVFLFFSHAGKAPAWY